MQNQLILAFAKISTVGIALQVAMVLAGHFNEFIRNNVFAIGGMLISMVVGAWFGRSAARSKAQAALGGAAVGADCALVGIAVSVGLGDTQPMILAFGTAGSAMAGLIGGLVLHAVAGKEPSARPVA
jgi:hypothetical protein